MTFLEVESVLKALRFAKRSSALAISSEEITVPHLETSEVEYGTGNGRWNHVLPIEGISAQKVGGNEGREEKSDDET